MIIKKIKTSSLVTKSKLPAADFVINPYVGCPHACKYCYASFMKRFTNHPEQWGQFLDVKICDKPIKLKELAGKSVFLSSVTDCYNKYEKDFEITKSVLEQIKYLNSKITITTKSDLILRDIEILKQFKNLTVSFSINTLDSGFQKDMDKASSIEDRLRALKILHDNKIRTALFMSPIFPYITDFKAIIERTKDYVSEFWFENLNLRGDYKYTIMNYVKTQYPKFYAEYKKIYDDKDNAYWENLENEIREYCDKNSIDYEIYFYHEKIKK